MDGPALKEDVLGVWNIFDGCIDENIEVLADGCPKEDVDAISRKIKRSLVVITKLLLVTGYSFIS